MFLQEKESGIPNPQLYNQYFINSYSLPKGLHAIYRDKSHKMPKKSLYDYK